MAANFFSLSFFYLIRFAVIVFREHHTRYVYISRPSACPIFLFIFLNPSSLSLSTLLFHARKIRVVSAEEEADYVTKISVTSLSQRNTHHRFSRSSEETLYFRIVYGAYNKEIVCNQNKVKRSGSGSTPSSLTKYIRPVATSSTNTDILI